MSSQVGTFDKLSKATASTITTGNKPKVIIVRSSLTEQDRVMLEEILEQSNSPKTKTLASTKQLKMSNPPKTQANFRLFAFVINSGARLKCLPFAMEKNTGKLFRASNKYNLGIKIWKFFIFLGLVKATFLSFRLWQALMGLTEYKISIAVINSTALRVALNAIGCTGHITFLLHLDEIIYCFNQYIKIQHLKREEGVGPYDQIWKKLNRLILTISIVAVFVVCAYFIRGNVDPNMLTFIFSILPKDWKNGWTFLGCLLFDCITNISVAFGAIIQVSILIACIMTSSVGLEIIRSDMNLSAYKSFHLLNTLFSNCFSGMTLPALALLEQMTTIFLVYNLIRNFGVIPISMYIATLGEFLAVTFTSYTAYLFSGSVRTKTAQITATKSHDNNLSQLQRKVLMSCLPFGVNIGSFLLCNTNTPIKIIHHKIEVSINTLLYRV